MKIFITGATGFIGNYVVNKALQRGHEVLAHSRKKNNSLMLSKPSIKWVISEILEIKTRDIESCDAIINLSAAGVSPQIAPWEEMFDVNVKAALKISKIAQELNIKRIVNAGTFHEYGASAKKFKKIPVNAPLEPFTEYGITKATSFHLLNYYSKNNNLELVYTRIFSAYGPGQNSKNFWPSLRQAALDNKDFYMTSGLQIRDFIKVEKVAEHLIKACERKDVKSGKPLIINVGTGKGKSLLQFASEEWKNFNAKGQLIPGGIKQRSEPDRFIADITKLEEEYKS